MQCVSLGVRRPTWGLHADDAQGSSPDVEVQAVGVRSWIKWDGKRVQPVVSISCRQTHAAVGLEVTLTWTSFRRRWLMKYIT